MDNIEGKYDERNKLNDLTGKEWLKLTKSFWVSEKSKDDRFAYKHPAPFLIKDIQKLISLFTKSGMKVLDPFVGSGTTIISATNINRYGIGIDLSEEYIQLSKERCLLKKVPENTYELHLGNALKVLDNFDSDFFDYIVTSPPYHNILKNTSSGLRSDNSSKGFRNGTRQGIEFYSNKSEDLGNQESFDDFIHMLSEIMTKCYQKLKNKKYCSIIISDFTVNKKEVCVQKYIVDMMERIGFEFVGTIVLLQDNKPLYPFGYPFAYKINHHHQNIINFRKNL